MAKPEPTLAGEGVFDNDQFATHPLNGNVNFPNTLGSSQGYLDFESEFLFAPFDTPRDGGTFPSLAGSSPSPPESSPKSLNTSPHSSGSSPPRNSTDSKRGGVITKGIAMMTSLGDDDDDFPMLDETAAGTVTFPLSSSSFFGTNFTPLVKAPTNLPSQLSGTGAGIQNVDRMSLDDPAKFFDFESAASSPMAFKAESSLNANVSRVMGNDPNQGLPAASNAFGIRQGYAFSGSNVDALPQMHTSTSTCGSRKKRRSESLGMSPGSADTLASFPYETNTNQSPAYSGIPAQNCASQRNSITSMSEEDDSLISMPRSTSSAAARPRRNPFTMQWPDPQSTSFFPSPSPMASMPLGYQLPNRYDSPYKLTLRGEQPYGKISEKSRVETQIRVNLNLEPFPPGITKLHLPTHTISKPKLLSKPPHQKSPETLELYTSLVCASALQQHPGLLNRVLQRAIDDPSQERIYNKNAPGLSAGSPDFDGDLYYVNDEDKPLHGGEVRICQGCMVRERKRAARKKVKKVEDETNWANDEHKRIIVFNCAEEQDWTNPEALINGSDNGETTMPEIRSQTIGEDGIGSIWLPMRIACYCRHQGEKIGFQIIFTIKDHEGKFIAQAITPPVLITDDHKTTVAQINAMEKAAAVGSSPNNANPDFPPQSPVAAPEMSNQFPSMPSTPSYDPRIVAAVRARAQQSVPTGLVDSEAEIPNIRTAAIMAQRAKDREQIMQRQQAAAAAAAAGPSSEASQSRAGSRQSSVTAPNHQSPPSYPTPSGSMNGSGGPSAKKRKPNSASKARNELTMTKLDTAPGPSTLATPAETPATPNFSCQQAAQPGIQPGMAFWSQQPYDAQSFLSGPQTPMDAMAGQYFGLHNRNQSMDSLYGAPVFSAPASAQASRVPSRVASPVQQFRMPAQSQSQVVSQQQFAQAAQAQAHNALLQHIANERAQVQAGFEITRIIPMEGPCQGGIEVTLLGSGFNRSHVAYFGDKVAARTEYWSDNTLVCILPPASNPGSVPVVLRYSVSPSIRIPGTQGRFNYTDDTDQKMLSLALQVINAKWTGKIEPPRDIAKRLLMDDKTSGSGGGSSTNADMGNGNNGNQHSHGRDATFDARQLIEGADLPTFELEAQLLKLLDILDMDDSPYLVKLNLRNRQGQTMLHLACSLGLSRFTAALLARGAHPDISDKGGYTPLHFAALHGHADLVRRLRLNRADPNARSLSGTTPEDMTDSDEVRIELNRGMSRSRRPSVSSAVSAPGRVGAASTTNGRRSRTGSIVSAMNAWEPFAAIRQEDEEDDYYGADSDEESETDELWIRPKRIPSGRSLRDLPMSMSSSRLNVMPRMDITKPLSRKQSMVNMLAAQGGDGTNDETDGDVAAPAAMAALVAWRDHLANLSANLPNLNNLNWNLPTMPNLPNLANLPNFQGLQGFQHQSPTQIFRNEVARFNAFMAQAQARMNMQGAEQQPGDVAHPPPQQGEYRWWDLFSNPAAPPAYEELYPAGSMEDCGDKKLHLIGEMIGKALEEKQAVTTSAVSEPSISTAGSSSRAPRSDSVTTASSEMASAKLRMRRSLTKEEEEALKIHHRKLQRIKGDRRLFFFWIPMLLIIVFTLLHSGISKTWVVVQTTYDVVKERMAEAAEATADSGRRIVEVG